MRAPIRALSAICAAALAGCTTPLFCPGGDWQRVGYGDAMSGVPSGYIAKYAEVCARRGITPDRAAWEKGYADGLARYCTERHAYWMGYNRGPLYNPGICPAEDRRRLDNAHHQGYMYREMLDDLWEDSYRIGPPRIVVPH